MFGRVLRTLDVFGNAQLRVVPGDFPSLFDLDCMALENPFRAFHEGVAVPLVEAAAFDASRSAIR